MLIIKMRDWGYKKTIIGCIRQNEDEKKAGN